MAGRTNPNIILQGRTPDFLGAIDRGNTAAARQGQFQQQNALRQFNRERGGDVLAGDQNALRGFAQVAGPEAALGVKSAQQGIQFNAEKMKLARQRGKRDATELAASLGTAERKAQAEELSNVMKGAAFFYKEGDEEGYTNFLKKNGVDPQQFPFEAFPATAATLAGVFDSLTAFEERGQDASSRLDAFSREQFGAPFSDLPAAVQSRISEAVASGVQPGSEEAGQVLGPDSGQSSAEEKIARMESIGIPREVAVRIADGVYAVSRDPLTEEVQVIDKSNGNIIFTAKQGAQPASGTSPEVAGPSASDRSAPAAGGRDLQFDDQFSASPGSFGVEGAVKGAINKAGDIAGLGAPFPDVLQTQRDFKLFSENLLNDLQNGYGGRVPAFLLKELRELTPQAGSALEGREEAKSKLNSIGRSIQTTLNSKQNTLSSQPMSPKTREKLEQEVIGLRTALDTIQSAISSFDDNGGGQSELPDWVLNTDTRDMTPAQLDEAERLLGLQ